MTVVLFRGAKPAPANEPTIGTKLHLIAMLDPAWVRALEVLVNWKLTVLRGT